MERRQVGGRQTGMGGKRMRKRRGREKGGEGRRKNKGEEEEKEKAILRGKG